MDFVLPAGWGLVAELFQNQTTWPWNVCHPRLEHGLIFTFAKCLELTWLADPVARHLSTEKSVLQGNKEFSEMFSFTMFYQSSRDLHIPF